MTRGVPRTDWKQRVRRGLPMMTPRMMAVLQTLRDAKKADWPFIPLPGVHKRTLRSLIARDWIFESPGLDGVRYTITERGARALKVYEPVVKRGDGLCPQCGERPRHVFRTGRNCGYCLPCHRENERRERALGLSKGRVDRPCSRCKKRPRHRNPGGSYSTYCTRCNATLKRQGRRKRRKALLRAIQNGASVPPCQQCKLRPRAVRPGSVDDLCAECRRAYMSTYNDQRRVDSKAAKARRSQRREASDAR